MAPSSLWCRLGTSPLQLACWLTRASTRLPTARRACCLMCAVEAANVPLVDGSVGVYEDDGETSVRLRVMSS